MNKQVLYKLIDLQDEEEDYGAFTLDEVRDWLCEFWTGEDNEEQILSEGYYTDMDDYMDDILASDEEELYDRLAGIDYTIERVRGGSNE